MIAPIFYVSQVDLCGPFESYSYHNKRATVKIWYAVFCCATTTTISIKCMEDYSTNAFLQAFTRISCEVGYPRRLLTDEGSQLVKACETLQIDFQDIQRRLFKESNVDFNTCPVGGHNMNGLVERKKSRSPSKNQSPINDYQSCNGRHSHLEQQTASMIYH
eukprot:TCONS_00035553-protein